MIRMWAWEKAGVSLTAEFWGQLPTMLQLCLFSANIKTTPCVLDEKVILNTESSSEFWGKGGEVQHHRESVLLSRTY